MANVHVLTQQGGRVRMVFHVAVPNVNNARNINYRTAIVNAGMNAASVMPSGDGTAGTIGAAEVTALANGSLVEIVHEIKRANLTVAGIDALVAQVAADTTTELQQRLQDFGATR